MRIAIASLALALAVAACGSAGPEREAVNPLAHAASATQAESSARMTLHSVTRIGGQAVTGSGSGLVQFKPAKVQLRFTAGAAGRTFSIDEVLDGTTQYMKLPKAAAAGLPNGKSWIKLDLDKATGGAVSGAMSQSTDPASQLKLLSQIAGAKAVGQATIDGTATTRYHGVIDYRTVAQSGPPALRKTAKLGLKVMAQPTVPVDVWVDDQSRVRREVFRISMKAIASVPAQKQTVTIGFSDFGADTSGIAPPAAADTYDATDLAASQLNFG